MSRPRLIARLQRWARIRLHFDLGSRRVATVGLALLCGGLLVLALSEITHGAAVQLLWPRGEGTITRTEYRGAGRYSRSYAHFTFVAPDGRTVRASTPGTSAFHPGKVGERVVVAHHPSDFGRADLVNAGHLYGTACISLLLAALSGWLTRRNFDGAIHLSLPVGEDSDNPPGAPAR